MGTTENFDITQTAFLFNWVANSSSLEKGDSQQLADYVYCSLCGSDQQHPNPYPDKTPPGLILALGNQLWGGDWQLVWGPGVYEIKPGSGKADNTAFVVYSRSKDTYIIAIAGTDPRAFLDWLKEDFQVGPNDCVDWQGFSPTGAQPTGTQANESVEQISLGTALGIWALGSQLVPSKWAPSGDGVTLTDYLKNLAPASDGSTLIFTGHSLGGALSPTLARWAKEANSKLKTIYAMPTAGPTPGNAAYQLTWDSAFPSFSLEQTNSCNAVKALNRDVWNIQDVVPHAWQYIFTPKVQSSQTSVDQQYYFSDASTDKIKVRLVSPIGYLVPGTTIRSIASGRQTVADEAFMTRSSNTTPFPSVCPIQYYDEKGQVCSLKQPTGPYTIVNDDEFFKDLGLIHVWGYGVAAFGLDFSVFTQLHPEKASE